MRRIEYFDKELTVEEYVKIQVNKNGGTQSVAFKEQLIMLCDSMGISYDERMSKSALYDLLIENGVTPKEFAVKFGVGVSSQVYQSAFDISHQDVKYLERHGALKKVGTYRFRAYGKYLYAPLYDIFQYAAMSEEDMKKLLSKFLKGTRPNKK